MFRKTGLAVLLCILGMGGSALALPVTYGGVTFPQGDVSFADSVVSFSVGNPTPDPGFYDPQAALGSPDFDEAHHATACSLGEGGTLVLQFTDNSLTLSGNGDNDLWIFEAGGDVESTFIWVSKNGATWYSVGLIEGSTRGIDIDAYAALYGWTQDDVFSFIKLQDDPNQYVPGHYTSSYAGADIDAVGAIYSAPPVTPPPVVPEPATFVLLSLGLGGFALRRRR